MHRIRPKGRLFDDDNNPELPDEDKSYAGDLVCCSNGHTPFEYMGGVLAGDFTIVEDIPNRKTTWTANSVNTIAYDINFIACCAKKIRFEYTAITREEWWERYPIIYIRVRKPTDDNFFDYQTDSTLLWWGEVTDSVVIQLEEQAGAEDFIPTDACGTHVIIEVIDGDFVGDELSVTLE